MGRIRTKDRDNKEAEKKRAKKNRENFRELIEDLNGCISTESLSTNKCLSTAVSILMLDKVHKSTDNKMISWSSSIGEPTPVSIDSCANLEFQHILCARDCFGLGFTEKGIILYHTPNINIVLGYKESILGEHLSRILPHADVLLRKVFIDGRNNFIAMVNTMRMGGKDVTKFYFRGKMLYRGITDLKMFLGYAEMKETLLKNPVQSFQINEVLINMDLTFHSKRNIYIDMLLGYPEFSDCTTEHVVTDDLERYSPSDDEKSIVREFHRNGFAQHLCRLHCYDGTLLFVLSKVFLHTKECGTPIMITYSLPFAFSSQGQDTIDEGMRFITRTESWLALIPAMIDKQPIITPVEPVAPGPPKDRSAPQPDWCPAPRRLQR